MGKFGVSFEVWTELVNIVDELQYVKVYKELNQ
jgi:hypothetical protein